MTLGKVYFLFIKSDRAMVKDTFPIIKRRYRQKYLVENGRLFEQRSRLGIGRRLEQTV